MEVNFSHVGVLRIGIGLLFNILKNGFEVSIDDEGNFELIVPTMKFHKKMLCRHFDTYHFIVYAVFKVFAPSHFAVKSLETVSAEVVFVFVQASTSK